MAEQKKKTSSKSSSRAKTSKKPEPAPAPKKRVSRGVYALVFLLLGAFAFLGYFENDGVFIKFLRKVLSGLFGGGFYLLPPVLLVCAGFMGFSSGKPKVSRIASIVLIPVMVGAFCQLFSTADYELSASMFKSLWADGTALSGGGAVCGAITLLFTYLFSKTGTAILFVCISVLMVLSICGITLASLVEKIRESAEREREIKEEKPTHRKKEPVHDEKADDVPAAKTVNEKQNKTGSAIDIPVDDPIKPVSDKRPSLLKKPRAKAPDEFYGGTGVKDEPAEPETQNPPEISPEPAVMPVEPEPAAEAPVQAELVKPIPIPAAEPVKEPADKGEASVDEIQSLIEESAKRDIAEALQSYKYPPLSLLSEPKQSGKRDSQGELSTVKDRLEMTLKSFGINASISNIINGPSITRYEMELEIGIKLNKLTNLADDIALSLGVSGVRIAAIPNKISTVGIEVPNKNVSTVYLRDIISSKEFTDAPSKLTFAIGKNISGDVMVGNISKLPHLLVAGTTGSGKSVCLNSLILSLMYKASPEEVKFIMIDPKMVEFKIYNGIPHLLIPVVTEAKKAAGALQWAVTEMMKRYRLFSDTGARDIASYNEAIAGTDEPQMPQIVVIIDELADLMMIAAKEVEESICRVAQMGRAAGVHLVIATQSPRADVITGLMKANIPSRIAFKVASSLESRIILDAGGSADKLVGNGDMLFAPIGTSKPNRIQGAWVSDEERERVVEFVKSSGEASYSEEVISQIEKAAAEKETGKVSTVTQEEKVSSYDDLLPQAADVIFETNQASVSMLQRRLKLGYARAARLVDQLEEIGVVGPFEGSKPRQILITRQQWHEMQFINGTAPTETIKPPSGGAQQTMYSVDDLFPEDDE